MQRPSNLNRGRATEGRTTRVSPLRARFQTAALSLVKIPAVDLQLLCALCALCALCVLCAVGVIARIAAPPRQILRRKQWGQGSLICFFTAG